MNRDNVFFDESHQAMEVYNDEISFIPDDEISILDKIKRMSNRHHDVPGTDEVFEKYKEIIYNHYKDKPNRRVVATKKLIKMLQDAVNKYESSGNEDSSDSNKK